MEVLELVLVAVCTVVVTKPIEQQLILKLMVVTYCKGNCIH